MKKKEQVYSLYPHLNLSLSLSLSLYFDAVGRPKHRFRLRFRGFWPFSSGEIGVLRLVLRLEYAQFGLLGYERTGLLNL